MEHRTDSRSTIALRLRSESADRTTCRWLVRIYAAPSRRGEDREKRCQDVPVQRHLRNRVLHERGMRCLSQHSVEKLPLLSYSKFESGSGVRALRLSRSRQRHLTRFRLDSVSKRLQLTVGCR